MPLQLLSKQPNGWGSQSYPTNPDSQTPLCVCVCVDSFFLPRLENKLTPTILWQMMPSNSHGPECFHGHVVWGMRSVTVSLQLSMSSSWMTSFNYSKMLEADSPWLLRSYWVTKRHTRTGQHQTSGRNTTPPNDSIARDTREGWREQTGWKNAKELRELPGTPKRLKKTTKRTVRCKHTWRQCELR